MDPSTEQHQEMPAHMLENMMVCLKAQPDQRKPRPQPEQALKCPRCDSTNTKFCYYNNYSLTQPRYFCKSCRRYWTKGGTLRNVPVGGGCRKNKRSSSSSSKRSQDQTLTPNTNPMAGTLPSLSYDSPNDLSLAFARLQKQSCGQLGFDEHDFQMGDAASTHFDLLGNQTGMNGSANSTPPPGFLGSLRNGFLDSQNIFPNFYYGYNDHNVNMGGEAENGGGGGEMAMAPYEEMSNAATTTSAVTVTTMKQEFCNNGRENHDNRVLWGFPWQLNGNGGSMADLDSGRESWNINGAAPSWHGLINSPLL